MPLGGWAGTVSQVDKDGTYMVLFSRATLDAIPPAIKQRCEQEGVPLDRYWLTQDDLEPDPGGPVRIECPEQGRAESPLPAERDDRIRAVFELTEDDPLPKVDEETLQTYYDFLAFNLSFPFPAEHTPESGQLFRHSRIVKVVGLGDPDEPMVDERYGVLCVVRHRRQVLVVPLAELEVEKGKPHRQLVGDYAHWFRNSS
jgi:hypothetical protein